MLPPSLPELESSFAAICVHHDCTRFLHQAIDTQEAQGLAGDPAASFVRLLIQIETEFLFQHGMAKHG